MYSVWSTEHLGQPQSTIWWFQTSSRSKDLLTDLEASAALMRLLFFFNNCNRNEFGLEAYNGVIASHLICYSVYPQGTVGRVRQMERYLCRRRTNLVADWNSCLMPRDTDRRLLGLWGFELSVERRRRGSARMGNKFAAKIYSLCTHKIVELVVKKKKSWHMQYMMPVEWS